MAFSGGNGDLSKGHLFWASSNDGVSWTVLKWDPKPPGLFWKPLIFPKQGDFCEKFGISQVQLTYDPSTQYGPQGAFYLHLIYIHSPVRAAGELDTYTFRFQYSSSNGFGLGGGTQVCLNSGGRGTPCNWVNHSGTMVFDYDGVPPEPGDPPLTRYGGNIHNLNWGAGSIVWDPSHGHWLRIFGDSQWQSTTSLVSGIWTEPQAVDMSRFHSQVKAQYPNWACPDSVDSLRLSVRHLRTPVLGRAGGRWERPRRGQIPAPPRPRSSKLAAPQVTPPPPPAARTRPG